MVSFALIHAAHPTQATPTDRLLILDDDPVVCELASAVAVAAGFATRAVAAPVEFFEALDGWRPTHIMVDLILPGQDGIEVFRMLADRQCRLPIVIVSSVEHKLAQSARRVATERGLNIVGVLAKPFDHTQLVELLRHCSTAVMPAVAEPLVRVPNEILFDDKLTLTVPTFEEALEQDQFVLHYQPCVDLRTGKIAGVEALVRWQHPLLGLVGPDRFIGSLESLGLIHRLSRRVIARAVEWFAQSGMPDEARLAINLSALDLGTLSLADHLVRVCEEHKLPPQRLLLELTESSAMDNPQMALATLTRLRLKRFGLAIDDFGTGYSSMAQLARMPFTSMKIDRSFVANMPHSPDALKIVTSIIGLGHALGMDLVAEGVESMEIAGILQSMDCDLVQGYAIAKPLDDAQWKQWSRQWDAGAFLRRVEETRQ